MTELSGRLPQPDDHTDPQQTAAEESHTNPVRRGTGRRSSGATSPLQVLVPPWVRRKRARAAAERSTSAVSFLDQALSVETPGPADQAGRFVDVDEASAGLTRARAAEAPAAGPASSQVVTRDVGSGGRGWWRWLGWSRIEEDSILVSTLQTEAVNPLLVATHPPMAGPPDGIDISTNNVLSLDPHLMYEHKLSGVTTAHVVVFGVVGSGKTSFVTTKEVVRQVAMGRQVAVFDRKKTQEDGKRDQGEYSDAVRYCGGVTVRFAPGGGGRVMNLLDPNLGDKQEELLELAAQYAHGPMTSEERAALTAARTLALSQAKAEGRIATIHDVIEALFTPSDESVPHPNLAVEGVVDRVEMLRWGMKLALDLRRFVDGDLAGLIDGDTSTGIDWDAPLLVFDTSDIPENSAALSLVMMLVTTFLTGVWAAKPRQRVLVLEEGYHTTNLAGSGGVTVPGLLKSLVKRGRGIGLSFVMVIHHVSDIPADSDAISLVQEAGLIHVYRQNKQEDINDIVNTYGLPPEVSGMLKTLPQGVQIVLAGTDAPRLMRHLRSKLEEEITDTDSALTGKSRAARAVLDTTAATGGTGAGLDTTQVVPLDKPALEKAVLDELDDETLPDPGPAAP